jgi:DNA-binding GntR family transcriptional regulator
MCENSSGMKMRKRPGKQRGTVVSKAAKHSAAAGIPARIAEQVREYVARGRFAPGVRLGQAELATQFGASRMPVREALKLLSAQGVVIHDPNRGYFVASLSSDDAHQLFRLREVVEDLLLGSIRWPTAAQLKELTRSAVELEELLDTGDRTTWWIRHREFHLMIFELSPYPAFVREAMRLWSLTDRYRSLLPLPQRRSSERSVVEKKDLVRALANKDRKRLLEVRAERRREFERMVLEVLKIRSL